MSPWDEYTEEDFEIQLDLKKQMESNLLKYSKAPSIIYKIDKRVNKKHEKSKRELADARNKLNDLSRKLQNSIKGEFSDRINEEFKKKQEELRNF